MPFELIKQKKKMTSASLARECIKVVSPLIEMIVDDDDKHMGQLKYPKDIETVKQAKQYLKKLLQDATEACVELNLVWIHWKEN